MLVINKQLTTTELARRVSLIVARPTLTDDQRIH